MRKARPEDAAAVARVHVRAWRAAYRGLIASDVIASRAAQRQGQWAAQLARGGERAHVLVAEADGKIVGFASGGPSPDEDLDPAVTAEVTGLYVDPGHWRRGIGRALLSELLGRLRAENFRSATLWVFAENAAARGFYESRGWSFEGSERRHPQRRALEVRYRLQGSPKATG